jgi:hypothetical protein
MTGSMGAVFGVRLDYDIGMTIRERNVFELCERPAGSYVSIPYCLTERRGCIIQAEKRGRIEEEWQHDFLSAILS